MKTLKTQHGFFDLGISLIILALGGGAAYVASDDQEEQFAETMQTETVELVYTENE
jgi:hypothetical protein